MCSRHDAGSGRGKPDGTSGNMHRCTSAHLGGYAIMKGMKTKLSVYIRLIYTTCKWGGARMCRRQRERYVPVPRWLPAYQGHSRYQILKSMHS